MSRRGIPELLTVTFAILLGAGVETVEAAAAVPGTSAPVFEVVTLSGEAYNNQTIKGRPTLLVFWASWCPVCRRELPNLAGFAQKGKPAQLQILSIGFSDLRGNIERYVQEHPESFAFPTAFDIDNDVAQAFKVTATPTLVLLDAEGSILLVHRGAGILQNQKFLAFLETLKG